jgi:hypothetical protein
VEINKVPPNKNFRQHRRTIPKLFLFKAPIIIKEIFAQSGRFASDLNP